MRALINTVHVIVYSHEAEAVRAFFANVLGWESVNAGGAGRSSRYHRPSSPPCTRPKAPTAATST